MVVQPMATWEAVARARAEEALAAMRAAWRRRETQLEEQARAERHEVKRAAQAALETARAEIAAGPGVPVQAPMAGSRAENRSSTSVVTSLSSTAAY